MYVRFQPALLAVGFILGILPAADNPESRVSLDPRPKPAAAPATRSNIRVDTNLVLIPVSVTDPLNRPVTGLEKEHFRIFEDKVEQS